MPKPYLLNVADKVAHKRPTHEECNADQIVRKRNADTVPPGYRRCEHCNKEESP